MSLPESLERAASELGGLADRIRPANGDPHRLLEELGSESAAKVLVWVLSDAPDAAEELIEAWEEVDEGVDVLLRVSDEGVPKAGRKALRRARHRLRSQGIEVAAAREPAPSRAAAVLARTADVDRFQAAHLSSPDFRGARMGYLVDRHPNGGARLFEIRFDESRGILDFKIYNAGRTKVRGFLRSLTQGNSQRLFEVEREALCALIRRASLAQPQDRPLPTAFVEWRARLFPESLDAAATPGGLARQALGVADDLERALEQTCTEIRESRIGPWPPAMSWVSEWMEKGTAAVEGLEGPARAERIEGWLQEVVPALNQESDVALLARHLEESAWARWRAGDEDVARALLAVADAIAAPGAPQDRVARARVEGLFGPFLDQMRVVESSPLDED